MIELPIIVDLTVNRNEVVFDFDLENTNPEIEFTSSNVINIELPTYDGDYVVDASPDNPVILETNGKAMAGNVTVNQLPTQQIQQPILNVNYDTGVISAYSDYRVGYNKLNMITNVNIPLNTLSGRTITPRFFEQTIMTRGQLATGTIKVAAVPRYDGVVEFTPSEQSQTIEISGKMAAADIVINPIPSNYGRIEWNGSFLAVI